jgi:hypothetical protein
MAQLTQQGVVSRMDSTFGFYTSMETLAKSNAVDLGRTALYNAVVV